MTYWDPMPAVRASEGLPMANVDGEYRLPAPETYLRGRWHERDWRNVPGPFYGALTDSCWTGREIAPGHIVYEDDFGGEVIFRQPHDAEEVRLVLTAAAQDPYSSWAADGDEHWTPDLVRDWWAGRERLVAWIEDLRRRWSVSDRADERDNADGLAVFGRYVDSGLETYLDGYTSWLSTDLAMARRARRNPIRPTAEIANEP